MFKLLIRTLVVVAATGTAAAQTAASTKTETNLTLPAAIAEAIAGNPELAALRQEYEAMRAAPALASIVRRMCRTGRQAWPGDSHGY